MSKLFINISLFLFGKQPIGMIFAERERERERDEQVYKIVLYRAFFVRIPTATALLTSSVVAFLFY